MTKEVILIKGKPYVCQNPDKDIWVPIGTQRTSPKTEPQAQKPDHKIRKGPKLRGF